MACEEPRLSTLIANHDKATIGTLVGVGLGGLVLGIIIAFAISRWRGGGRDQRNDLDKGSFLKLQGSISSTSARKSYKLDRWPSVTSSGPRAVKRLSSKFAEMHKGLNLPKPVAQSGGERNYSPRMDSFPPSPGFPLGPLSSRSSFPESDTRARKYSEASEYAVTGTPMGEQIDKSSMEHDSSFHRSILDNHSGASAQAHSTAYENHPWGYTAGSSSGLGSGSLSQRQDAVKRPTSVSSNHQLEPQFDILITPDESSSPKELQFSGVANQTQTTPLTPLTPLTPSVLSPSLHTSHADQASPSSNRSHDGAIANEAEQVLSPQGVGERKGLVRQVSNARAASSASFYKEQATRHLSLAHVQRAPNSPILGLPDSPGGAMGDIAHDNNNFSFARGYNQSVQQSPINESGPV